MGLWTLWSCGPKHFAWHSIQMRKFAKRFGYGTGTAKVERDRFLYNYNSEYLPIFCLINLSQADKKTPRRRVQCPHATQFSEFVNHVLPNAKRLHACEILAPTRI